jgi:hypothetical protein
MSVKISDLTAGTTLASGDLFAFVDVSDTTMAASGTTKKLLFSDLLAAIPIPSSANIYTDNGTLTSNRTLTMGTYSLLFSGNETTFRGFSSTSSNFALKVQNSSSQDLVSFRNDGYISFNEGVLAGFSLLEVSREHKSVHIGGTLVGAQFSVIDRGHHFTVVDIRNSVGIIFRAQSDGSDPSGNTWTSYFGTDPSKFAVLNNWKAATYGTGLTRLVVGGQAGGTGLLTQTQNIWDTGSPSWLEFNQNTSYGIKGIKIDSVKGGLTPDGNTFAQPFIDVFSDDADISGSTKSGKSRIASLGHSWLAVSTGTANNFLGVGTDAPTSKLQVVGLPTYADNAAALAGGLTAGAMYIRTGHGLDIVV